MNKDTEKTKVIFRVTKGRGRYEGDELVAVFPELAGDMNPYRTCAGYVHLGQHVAVDAFIVDWSRPAKPEEYEDLAEELESLGYNLKIAKKFNYTRELALRKGQCNGK